MMTANHGPGNNCSIKRTVNHLTNNPLTMFVFYYCKKKVTVKFLLYIFPHVIIDEKHVPRKKKHWVNLKGICEGFRL